MSVNSCICISATAEPIRSDANEYIITVQSTASCCGTNTRICDGLNTYTGAHHRFEYNTIMGIWCIAGISICYMNWKPLQYIFLKKKKMHLINIIELAVTLIRSYALTKEETQQHNSLYYLLILVHSTGWVRHLDLKYLG